MVDLKNGLGASGNLGVLIPRLELVFEKRDWQLHRRHLLSGWLVLPRRRVVPGIEDCQTLVALTYEEN